MQKEQKQELINNKEILKLIFNIFIILKIMGLTVISTLSWWLIFTPLFVIIIEDLIKLSLMKFVKFIEKL